MIWLLVAGSESVTHHFFILDLREVVGRSKNLFSQMVVKNGDEFHGIESVQKSPNQNTSNKSRMRKNKFSSPTRNHSPEVYQFAPEKLQTPKRKGLSSNHHFSGENSLLNFGRCRPCKTSNKIQAHHRKRWIVLVVERTNPSETYSSSNWIISSIFGVKIKNN